MTKRQTQGWKVFEVEGHALTCNTSDFKHKVSSHRLNSSLASLVVHNARCA
jgi:hypothetical protein